MKKLSIKGLALAFGVAWGVLMLLLGWISMFGYGAKLVEILSSFYIGYNLSFFGGIIGALWGVFSGAIWGLIIASVYNIIVERKKE